MEKLYPSNKVRFRHLYDKTDKEEQILFYRCSLMVETYIKIHVRNQEDVYNLRQEVLLKVVEGLDKSYHERGRFFQWAMTYGAQNETYIEGWEKKISNLLIYKRLCKV